MHCAKSSNFAYKNNKIKLFEVMKRICAVHYLSLLFLVLCNHLPLAAQSDTAVMRISYDAKFKTCVERPAMQDEMEFVIGNNGASFILRQTYGSSMCLTAWCRLRGDNCNRLWPQAHG